MSHFSQVRTRLTNGEILKKTLTRLGYTLEEATEGVQVRGYFGESQQAEFKILTSTHYDIGFVRDESGSFRVVGDWELLPKVSGISQEEFLKKVKRGYAREAITEIANNQGLELSVTEAQEGESIEMVVTQW